MPLERCTSTPNDSISGVERATSSPREEISKADIRHRSERRHLPLISITHRPLRRMPGLPHKMALQTVYRSAHPAPPLHRQSIFSFLFPEAPIVQAQVQTAGGTGTCPRTPPRPLIPAERPTQVDPLTCPPRILTRGQVLSNALRLASGLRDARTGVGLNKGDVVGLVGLNSLEWLNAMYGSWAAGLRVSPVNWA